MNSDLCAYSSPGSIFDRAMHICGHYNNQAVSVSQATAFHHDHGGFHNPLTGYSIQPEILSPRRSRPLG